MRDSAPQAGTADHYEDGTYTWWHLAGPAPELCEALTGGDGWLGPAGVVLDVGCGLGSDAIHLSELGWIVAAIDLSAAALSRAAARATGPLYVRADVRSLPFPPGTFDAALDRGCFHYLPIDDRPLYASALRAALRPGGRLLLRASLRTAGIRNDVDESVIEAAFAGWHIDSLQRRDLPSDTRLLEMLVVRLRAPE